ncbi:Pentapeptide repeats (9 copies) [uncultured archaeon]|nr:Pentapeptide repeats (9 copies) [uncultured archaeon]
MADETHSMIPISADWVLKRIQEGKKVRLRNAVIEDDLDLRQLNLPKISINQTEFEINVQGLSEYLAIVTSILKITDSCIKGTVNFSNTIFRQDISFEGAQFERDAKFSHSKFLEYANFCRSKFSRIAEFGRSQFAGNTMEPVLIGIAPNFTVSGDYHLGSANFSETKFSGAASLITPDSAIMPIFPGQSSKMKPALMHLNSKVVLPLTHPSAIAGSKVVLTS